MAHSYTLDTKVSPTQSMGAHQIARYFDQWAGVLLRPGCHAMEDAPPPFY